MSLPPKPPTLDELPAGTTLYAGLGVSTVLPDFDFETYSEAGFCWNEAHQKWDGPHGSSNKGLPAIGAAAYAEHPSTKILCIAYDLKDGRGKQQWKPGMRAPYDLIDYIRPGAPIEAWNAPFEHWIWHHICHKRWGWPDLSIRQLRCAAAKARAHALPGSLDAAGKVLDIKNKKDKEGERLLKKFSMPQKPTKNQPLKRFPLVPGDSDTEKLYAYNIQDIRAEAEASSLIPDLSTFEQEFWFCDRAINFRGVHIDTQAIEDCISIIEQAHAKYNAELRLLTGGQVQAASEVSRLTYWIREQGQSLTTLRAQDVDDLLKRDDLPVSVRRALEIRELIGSAAVKKLYALSNYVTQKGTIHDLFIYHSARTGRAAGSGPQLQNFPNSGPAVYWCRTCDKRSITDFLNPICKWCGLNLIVYPIPNPPTIQEWNNDAVEDALYTISSRSLECVEFYWEDAIAAVSGCLRGLIISAPGHDFICSDYSAIEAVVLAALAGEGWRLEVFRTHGKIYEMSASKITGIPFEEFEKYPIEHNKQHHPMRKKIGKVAELASGFGGGLVGWKAFGAAEHLTDDEISNAVRAWRKASPAIVEIWGGQERNWKTEYYGLEGMAALAIMTPGQEYTYRGITYLMRQGTLYCRLLSGRYLTYHNAKLSAKPAGHWSKGWEISYETWNTNPKYGAIGWIRLSTWGGKLTENVVQATARDILAYAIVNLERAGYPVVLQIHDEIVCEMPTGQGSIEELERIMSTMPEWAKDWPIRAKGGWRGKRYRK
jgi:DNA polymerase